MAILFRKTWWRIRLVAAVAAGLTGICSIAMGATLIVIAFWNTWEVAADGLLGIALGFFLIDLSDTIFPRDDFPKEQHHD